MTRAPIRIQRRLTKGWRAPEGAVYVGRGSHWSNRFIVGARYVSRSAFHDAPFPAANKSLGITEHPAWAPWPSWTEAVDKVRDRQHATELFRAHVTYCNDTWDLSEIRAALSGRDLMCWCPLPAEGEPDHCHAAVLLDLANGAAL
ncbi:DUF4326 domain-containing protein [Streptomyces sp. NEAU-H3]|uniref:DUF4326 domain-containing protein n=1 Tax=Streptomyces sp. NEAU-H3 TaxID=2720636 RepID=UPI00143AE369|nr:DUF4326 domain-containing protein [Streptomyces sp. NEAU-H3]NJA56690.1 DUF4326 domain-containing protein [Streptomyces sp. NEAU-H3]